MTRSVGGDRFRAHARKVINAIAVVWVSFWALAIVARCAGIKLVYTPSVPVGVYWAHSFALGELRRGDYVCLEAWRDEAPKVLKQAIEARIVPGDWLAGESLTKVVVGLPGDLVQYEGDGADGSVIVNGSPLANSGVIERDSAGVRLPRAEFPVVLGDNEVWLTSVHPRGFDSRYYGPVDARSLACKAELLWAW